MLRDLLGHVLPADLRGVTGEQASVGPPWFDRYTVPAGAAARAALRARAGDRLAPGDGRQPAPRRCSRRRWPRAGRGAARRWRRWRGASRPRCACSASPPSCSAAVGQEFVARRARAAGDGRATACRARSSRSCAATAAATAATSCTSGSRCCSSASPPRRRSSTERDVRLTPGQRARVGGYDVTYVRPTGKSTPPRTGGSRGSTSAPTCACARTASASRRCTPSAATSPSMAPMLGPFALLRGRGDERGRPEAGPAARRLDGDRARHERAAPRITEGDQVFTSRPPS